jgi:hypothetical protein
VDHLLDQPDGTAAAPLLGDLDSGLSRGRFESGGPTPRDAAPVVGLVASAPWACRPLRPRIGVDRNRPEFVNADHTRGGRGSSVHLNHGPPFLQRPGQQPDLA